MTTDPGPTSPIVQTPETLALLGEAIHCGYCMDYIGTHKSDKEAVEALRLHRADKPYCAKQHAAVA